MEGTPELTMAGKGPLRQIIENFLVSNIPPLMWANVAKHVAEEFERETAADYREFLDYLLSIPKYPPQIRKVLEFTFKGKHQGGAVVLIGAVIGAIVAIVVGIVSPVFFIGQYAAQRLAQTWRFPLDLGFASYFRSPASRTIVLDHLKDQGMAPEAFPILEELFKRRVSDLDLIKLIFRDPDNIPDYHLELKKRGYDTEEINRAMEMGRAYPGPSDLLAWTVRDAFSPESVQRFQLDADLPDQWRIEARKLGLQDRFIEAAWAAHWEKVSPQQAFEMLHRLRPEKGGETFTDDDLDLLLKVQDIPPYFRNKLKAIAYNPLTRVDIRRMYHLGVLDLAGVYNAYLDDGYDKTHAAQLTEFTVKDVKDEYRSLTQGIILEAYRDKVFTREQAISQLEELRYASEDIAVIMAIEDFKQRKAEMNIVLDNVEAQYLAGELSNAGVYSALGSYNLEQHQIEFLIKSWDIKRNNKVTLLTVTQLEKLYERNIIELEDFRFQLSARGYSGDRLDWLIKLLEQEIQERAEDKAEKARKEQERLVTATKVKTYQVDKAELDVTIAEIELHIAEIKVARSGVTDATEKAKLATDIATLQADKEKQQLAIAELKRDTLQV